jgi:2-iminobutanoate/2-iminopropanoate deaminase
MPSGCSSAVRISPLRRGRHFGTFGSPFEVSAGTLADVVSLRIYIVDYKPEKAEAVSAALRECFRGSALPAATWIGVVALADPGFLIEVEAIAVID